MWTRGWHACRWHRCDAGGRCTHSCWKWYVAYRGPRLGRSVRRRGCSKEESQIATMGAYLVLTHARARLSVRAPKDYTRQGVFIASSTVNFGSLDGNLWLNSAGRLSFYNGSDVAASYESPTLCEQSSALMAEKDGRATLFLFHSGACSFRLSLFIISSRSLARDVARARPRRNSSRPRRRNRRARSVA